VKPVVTVSEPTARPVITESNIGQVMQLGFSRSESENALEMFCGDVNKACDMLLDCGFVFAEFFFSAVREGLYYISVSFFVVIWNGDKFILCV